MSTRRRSKARRPPVSILPPDTDLTNGRLILFRGLDLADGTLTQTGGNPSSLARDASGNLEVQTGEAYSSTHVDLDVTLFSPGVKLPYSVGLVYDHVSGTPGDGGGVGLKVYKVSEGQDWYHEAREEYQSGAWGAKAKNQLGGGALVAVSTWIDTDIADEASRLLHWYCWPRFNWSQSMGAGIYRASEWGSGVTNTGLNVSGWADTTDSAERYALRIHIDSAERTTGPAIGEEYRCRLIGLMVVPTLSAFELPD